MSRSTSQEQWLDTVLDQLRALDGVELERLEDGRTALRLAYNGLTSERFLAASADDYRARKIQYAALCDAITELGIEEGKSFVPPPPGRRTLTPQMIAARERRKKTFEAWQEVWRTIRKAEKALDVEYEIAQMKDYY